MQSFILFMVLSGVLSNTLASPTRIDTAKRATYTVDSVDSASDLYDCSQISIVAFEVPAGGVLVLVAI